MRKKTFTGPVSKQLTDLPLVEPKRNNLTIGVTDRLACVACRRFCSSLFTNLLLKKKGRRARVCFLFCTPPHHSSLFFFCSRFNFLNEFALKKACYAGYKPPLVSIFHGLWGWVPQDTSLGSYLSRSSHPHLPGLCQR